MGKSSHRNLNYRSTGSPHAMRLASFRKQMADFARAELYQRPRYRGTVDITSNYGKITTVVHVHRQT